MTDEATSGPQDAPDFSGCLGRYRKRVERAQAEHRVDALGFERESRHVCGKDARCGVALDEATHQRLRQLRMGHEIKGVGREERSELAQTASDLGPVLLSPLMRLQTPGIADGPVGVQHCGHDLSEEGLERTSLFGESLERPRVTLRPRPCRCLASLERPQTNPVRAPR